MDVVLVLNADYSLLEVVSWQRAVSMLVRDKVRIVTAYADRLVRSELTALPFPAVVARTRYIKPQRRVRFSRRNILARDFYTCQYCGTRPRRSNGSPKLEALTIDHVVPRAQARAHGGWVHLPWAKGKRVRVSSWENVLTACEACNSLKAARTPHQAKMRMRKTPAAPSTVRIATMSLFRYDIPDEWEEHVPQSWRNYWDVELDDT